MFREWLRNLVAPCLHTWVPWRERFLHRNLDNRVVGTETQHRCSKCGLTRTDRVMG